MQRSSPGPGCTAAVQRCSLWGHQPCSRWAQLHPARRPSRACSPPNPRVSADRWRDGGGAPDTRLSSLRGDCCTALWDYPAHRRTSLEDAPSWELVLSHTPPAPEQSPAPVPEQPPAPVAPLITPVETPRGPHEEGGGVVSVYRRFHCNLKVLGSMSTAYSVTEPDPS